MHKNDRDAEQWMAANAKWQYKRLIAVKESGAAHYVDETGYVIIEKEKKDGQNQTTDKV